MATRRKPLETGDDDDQNTSLVRVSQQEAAQLRAIQSGQMPDPDTDVLEEVEETGADRIARMLGDTGSDARAVVKLYKVKVEGQSFCQDYTVSQFENGGLNMVRKQWGAGEYKVLLYGTVPGTNRIALRARDTMMLEALADTAVANDQSSDVAKILQAMQEQNRAVMDALTNRPAVDPHADMMKMFTMVSAMKEAFGMNSQPQKSSITEMVEAMRELKAVSGELNGEKTEDENGLGSLVKLAAPIISMVQQRMQPQQAAEQGFPTLAVPDSMNVHGDAPVFDPSQPMQSPQPETEGEDMNALAMMLMHTHLKILTIQAKTNGDVEKGAEYVLDQLPDEMIDALENENWWMMLTHVAPSVSPYQAWFTSVRDRALAILAEEDAKNPEPPSIG